MWNELTPDLLLSRITEPEQNALDTAAVAFSQENVLGDVARDVAAEWRGGLARVVTLSKRPLALPSEVMMHVLADYRYRAYTRLPGMEAFLDDRRVAEWTRANHVRDNLGKVQIDPPAADDMIAGTAAPSVPSISVPHHILD